MRIQKLRAPIRVPGDDDDDGDGEDDEDEDEDTWKGPGD